MGFYQFKKKLEINRPIEEIWDFISDPKNLKKITPDYMGFDIITKEIDYKMHPGMIIAYKVSPVLGIPTTWVTEITQVEDKKFFVDEQRIGPYKIWHHEHHLEATDNGTLMTDIVSYAPPLGILGAIANSIFIKHKLESIFDYRTNVLTQIFK